MRLRWSIKLSGSTKADNSTKGEGGAPWITDRARAGWGQMNTSPRSRIFVTNWRRIKLENAMCGRSPSWARASKGRKRDSNAVAIMGMLRFRP